jgi:hypothetical protein
MNKGGKMKDFTQMDPTRQAAYLCMGNPGFWDFFAPVAHAFKAAAPIISTATSFIPFVGPLVSKAVDLAAGAVGDDPTSPNDDNLDDGTGANSDEGDTGY